MLFKIHQVSFCTLLYTAHSINNTRSQGTVFNMSFQLNIVLKTECFSYIVHYTSVSVFPLDSLALSFAKTFST